jgi:Leucine-rich repeat (LRR) protein
LCFYVAFSRILDLSFNRIKEIEGLDKLEKLEKLFLSSNKITKIKNVKCLKNLTMLELGDNKIRVKQKRFGCELSNTRLLKTFIGHAKPK